LIWCVEEAQRTLPDIKGEATGWLVAKFGKSCGVEFPLAISDTSPQQGEVLRARGIAML